MKRFLLSLATLALLSACASAPQSTGTNQTKPPVTIQQNPVNTPETTNSQPSILIKDRPARAIFDDIVVYRKQKGMQLKRRTAQRLEFSMQIPNVTQATEARMSYILAPLDGGWQLSARVWQITAPGTARESVSEITSAVADKIHEELQTYARSKP
ncbi:hypothetical protein [Iodobacter fluviatilis]|uniref:Uncharacterized protein YceK n=1 Tax=Iodobacter fluviatilis TaxID=537 RepID=A0A377SWV8_9NEIS|nr:hypothetical protein [Iodobacter fluviatilis]TCU85563.1 uncharacterized protein YceK [Iodobacter fluviatilis]STR44989.1 Uncharacterised protein [Iodobacter fluviatilis]